MVHLTPLPAGGIGAADVDVPAAIPATEAERTALEFLGPTLPDEIARGIAEGERPCTLGYGCDGFRACAPAWVRRQQCGPKPAQPLAASAPP
jgi:hypothetical protein